MVVSAYDERGIVQKLDGASRAAVLLLALGPAGAGRLLKHLDHDEIRALRQGASGKAPVSREELDDLVTEFQDAFRTGPGLSGLDLEMQRLLEGSLPEEDLTAVLGAAPPSEDRRLEPPVWTALAGRGREALAAILASEHPQVVAIVLRRLPPDLSAELVSAFDGALRNEVLRRMLVSRPPSASAELLLEGSLRLIHLSGTADAERVERHGGFAEIVNRMDRQQAEELLSMMAQTQPDEVAAVRRLLFSFEDIASLSRKARLVLFDEVPADTVTVALVGTADDLREVVLSSLAARARRMVEAELSQPRDLDERDILAARRSVAALALRLSGEARISLSPEAA